MRVTSQLPARNRNGQRACESFVHAICGNYGICDLSLTFRAVEEGRIYVAAEGHEMRKPTYLYVSTYT
jgi:hypothetical protein